MRLISEYLPVARLAYTEPQTLFVVWRDTGNFRRIYCGPCAEVARRMIALLMRKECRAAEVLKIELCKN